LLSENKILADICEEYAAVLLEGSSTNHSEPYIFDRLSTGHEVSPSFRRFYRKRLMEEDESGERSLPTPFAGHDDELVAKLFEPLTEQPLLNEFMLSAWKVRPDVQSAFPDPSGRDSEKFRNWASTSGISEGLIEKWQIPKETFRVPSVREFTEVSSPGVNIHGYLTAEMGMGELGRMVVRAAGAAGLPYTAFTSNRHQSRSTAEFSPTESTTLHPVDIVVINADQMRNWAEDSQKVMDSTRKRVGVWAWEVEEFPASFGHAFDLVDEVWAISTFAQKAIQQRTRKPVFTLPLPAPLLFRDDVDTIDLTTLGLPNTPYFLVMFDYLSVIDRKNPFAAVDAFLQAFSERDDVQLVIKTINSSHRILDRERLRHHIRKHNHIRVIEDFLTSSQVSGLMRGALAYVSLHRSEGYGLTCSEAMAMGVPVIATGYSGNMDFMNEANSLLVPFQLLHVDRSVEVYQTSAVWAEPDVSTAAIYMRRVFDDPDFAARVGEAGYTSIFDMKLTTHSGAFVAKRIRALTLQTKKILRDSPDRTLIFRRIARRLPPRLKAAIKALGYK
jgi:glycosyltransferase involved in cell wall biosynthesis